MLLTELGSKLYKQALAAASLTFTPLNDRAAIVTRIFVDKPSAADTWVLSTAGTELARYDIETTGNQQLLSGPFSAIPKQNDIFDACNQLLGQQLIYPVPLGQTMSISSAGAATANVLIEYEEHSPGDVPQGMMNHPQGTRRVFPYYAYVAASLTTVGEKAFDTEIKPSGTPSFLLDGTFPAGWEANVWAAFFEGGGRNTFAGSADTQSTTTYVACYRNGTREFTRESSGGIPLVGQASAAGSANTVIGDDLSVLRAFQSVDLLNYPPGPFPIRYRPGDNYQWRLNIAGAISATTAYAAMRQLFLVDARLTGAQP